MEKKQVKSLEYIEVSWVETASCSRVFSPQEIKDITLDLGHMYTQKDLKAIAKEGHETNLFTSDIRDWDIYYSYTYSPAPIDLTKRR